MHSAIHAARHDAGCVIHLHSDAGVAVATLSDGLMPINQAAMLIIDEIAYHDYEGVAVDREERVRLGRNLGSRNVMILRNHGTLTLGENVAEAFVRMALLERACAIQLRVLAAGRAVCPVTPEACARTAAIGKRIAGAAAARDWAAHRRRLDRQTTDYMV